MSESYLILGATGTVGRRVLATMRSLGHVVKGASRRNAAGPDFRRFDLLEPATHVSALEGVSTVMLISRPGDEEAHIHAEPFIDAMVGQRVGRVVVLSALGAEKRADFSLRKVEALVERSGMAWTHVRPNFFMQMLASPPLCTEIVTRNTLSLPLDDAKVAYVDADDVAAVLVRALIDPTLAHQSFEVNGPRSLDHDEVTALIARQVGREIRYVPLDEDSARRLLAIRGLSPPHVERVLRFYALTRQGECAASDTTVAALLGRPLGTFEAFVAANAAAW
ncbi:putative nucleoside-diphosphate sugar epimerase [Singulisphaera acidiphila DSM 18658]|uniref:Putative nucleoside-diphosphate sugar epimerase n=2 Tax=Singulisphaera acidiphila TaxID=466153 RepID=L0DHT5_SINAD|nr:putative nucleoside-diphosphate sugar epimerase [Singulisphaera acidiphila DSM 18658]